MRAADWIVDFLIKHGTTDVFGIPGVVVMDFLYAVDRRKPEITPHLNYHEQGASFAACGYAQTSGKLGVAYATRGPGFTNMLTAMADAYYDSLPVMFITAHSALDLENKMRVMNNQEIDTVALAKIITKKAARIDDIDELQVEVLDAYRKATSGRKGPVFLDIYNALFLKEFEEVSDDISHDDVDCVDCVDGFIRTLEANLKGSKRPIILIGNGARDNKNMIEQVAEKNSIPVLSSRTAQDIVPQSPWYYGFVGSRAIRYSNFILSKADLIIAIGNRLSFPLKSKSFLPITENARLIRVDIDESEFIRNVPNSSHFKMDCSIALNAMNMANLGYGNSAEWIKVCDTLRSRLDKWDKNFVVENIMKIIGDADKASPITCDVGNHSFWVTTAYAYQKASNRIIYSGSFGTLGSALPKAIGAYYSARMPVICFTGDQGVQFNIQELQFIVSHNLPITIVVLNNSSSGMIMEREVAKYGEHLIHTTIDSGYSYPDFKKIAECYGLDYIQNGMDEDLPIINYSRPNILEIVIDKDTVLEPGLPIGKACQDLSPELPKALYEELNNL